MVTTLVENGLIVTQDPERRILRGHVRAEDGRITHVGPDAPTGNADETVDARGKIVMPGLVNAHTHLAMTLLRGYGDDLPLDAWLRTRIWPAEGRMTRDDVLAGVDLGLAELLSSGTTTFNDMYFFPDESAEHAARAGARAVIGVPFLDFPIPGLKPEDARQYALAFFRKWRSHPLITPALAPHSSYACGQATLDAVADLRAALSREAGGAPVLVHTHCSETREEVQDAQTRTGLRPVGLFQKHGLLTPSTVLAHCGWITKGEVMDVAGAGASAAHCPVSNMKLATGGWMPLPEMWDAGVPVALGTDGAASNNTLDLFETMKFTALAHKQHRWDARVAPAQRVLDAATRDGARALGLDARVGSIEVGKRCDLAVVNLAKPRLAPLHDVVSQLVYATRGGDVFATLVDGRLVYADGNWRTLDVASVLRRAEAAAARVTSGAA